MIPHLSQHSLKGSGILRRVHIKPLIAVLPRIHMVRIGYGHIFPFHAQNIPQNPVRNISCIDTACAGSLISQAYFLSAMYYVHQCPAVLQQHFTEGIVIGIHMGILDIIIHPYSMEDIERCGILFIILIDRFIKIRLQYGINPDSIGSHFLNQAKPPKICLLINGELC